ncbi:ACT domain-containing protein ACR6 [Striga hermonthica]|uniref:ACT domain-containing protein ACR n=1 Tax=Striga hermonthica TaxID=68872 RepID=A0A9N7MRD9_STRHE|nr:ACT domain-containing protein ACR6 [Striga hermonthica]
MFEKFDGRDDEFAKLLRRINLPMVVIDNDSCEDATVIQVDSVNKHGILLQVVQVLTDLNLVIKKAYISSDGGWFMDVFNVINRDGEKVRDQEVINYIQKRLKSDEDLVSPLNGMVGLMPFKEHTYLHCNVVNAEIWTHNTRAAAVVHVTDDNMGCAIEDPKRLATIKKLLRNVLKGNNDLNTAKMTLSPPGVTHRERRLHQIMFADRDYEKTAGLEGLELELCAEDRVRLLSDITGIFGKRVCASKEPKSRQRAGKQGTLFTSRM